MDLDVLPNAQCTQFHGKWAEKDRNFGVTLMIEPVFMRATREGVKIIVVTIGLVIWLVILLVKDPNGVFEKKFTKNEVIKNGLHCSPFLFLMFELFIK